MIQKIVLLMLAASFTQCGDSQSPTEALQSLSLVQVIERLPADLINGTAEALAADGALGRNKEGYFHVRFQLGIPQMLPTRFIVKTLMPCAKLREA
jgi:hypothetical protein